MPTLYRHNILYRLIRAVHVYSRRYRRGNTYTVRLRWFQRLALCSLAHTLSHTLCTDSSVCIGSVLFVFAFMFKSRAGFISIAFLWRLLCNLYGILIHTNTWTLLLMFYFSFALFLRLFVSFSLSRSLSLLSASRALCVIIRCFLGSFVLKNWIYTNPFDSSWIWFLLFIFLFTIQYLIFTPFFRIVHSGIHIQEKRGKKRQWIKTGTKIGIRNEREKKKTNYMFYYLTAG